MSFDPSLDAHILHPRALSPGDVELWAAFCASDASLSHPFFSYAFARAVDSVHPRAYVAVIRRHGKTVGFFPFQFEGPVAAVLRAAQRIGGELSDRFGIIAREPLGMDQAALLRLAGLGSLTFSFLPTEQARHGLSSSKVTTGQRVILPGGRGDFWKTLKATSRKFVSQVERNERLLTEQLGPLQMTFEANPAAELSRLIAVKVAQYERTGSSNPLGLRWTTDLFRALLQTPDPECTAVLSTLYAGEHWLASHLGVMSPKVFHYWFPVYNVDHARFSPGHILTKELIEAAIARGIGAFDLGGFGQYKSHFQPQSYGLYAGFWRSEGFAGLVNQVAQSWAWRIAALRTSRGKPEVGAAADAPSAPAQ